MVSRLPRSIVVNREYLEIRSRLLDIAAALDRIERAGGSMASADQARLAEIHRAIRMLVDEQQDRASRIQLAFSDPYDPGWRNAKA